MVKALTLTGAAIVIIAGCSDPYLNSKKTAAYVGREKCADCHSEQTTRFAGSDHDLAMQLANDTTVLGDFDDVSVSFKRVNTRFYKRADSFFVETEDSPVGKQTYQIKYTFGVWPLQQYLVEIDNGRLQCLPFCWDSRSEYEGGDRWFHISGDKVTTPDSLLHWTRLSQNWNMMCAECHSTNLRKSYDPASDSYSTSWSEIDVSCEACHGPASEHLVWAKDSTAYNNDRLRSGRGFASSLTPSSPRKWLIDTSTGNARLQGNNNPTNEIEICARCHSHRTQVSDKYDYTMPLANSHAVSLIQGPLYYIDGEMREEVYVYGSFLQSKMYAHGVICSDCHDPHSLKLKADDNVLCGQCHQLTKYDTTEHHKHEPDRVECVDCHMPEHTYMVVDNRRDHRFSVSRPDLSEQLDTPNACMQCHRDQTNGWASKHFAKWYPERTKQSNIGKMMQSAKQVDPRVFSDLQEYSVNQTLPAILRATAIAALKKYPIPCDIDKVTGWLDDSSAIVRRAAVDLFSTPTPIYDPALLLPRLDDSIRTVRIAVAKVLSQSASLPINHSDSVKFNFAFDEYLDEQQLNADHPSGRLNLAEQEIRQGRAEQAEQEIKSAIAQEPLYAPAYVNLADHYRMQGKDSLGVELLTKALKQLPNDAGLHHALGLALVRTGKKEQAMTHLRTAFDLESDNSRFAYLLAVALIDSKQLTGALGVIESGLINRPNNLELIQTAITIARMRNDTRGAAKYQERLNRLENEYRTQAE